MAASLRSGLGFVGYEWPPPPARRRRFARLRSCRFRRRLEPPPRPAVAGPYAVATAAIASRRIIESVDRIAIARCVRAATHSAETSSLV